MRRSFFLIATVLMVMAGLMSSCHYKDLCYDHDHGPTPTPDDNLLLVLELKLELDVDLPVSDAAHTKIHVPTYMVVNFYDIESGALKKTEYVGPYGGPLHVTPGTYDMVVYSFDTEYTQERGESNIKTLEAFTSDITASKQPLFSLVAKDDTTSAPGPIIWTPDHLLVARKRVEIPPYSEVQRVITIEAAAETIVETYAFEVPHIVGIEYAQSVDAFVTNQALSNYFGRDEVNASPATVYFPVDVNRKDSCFQTTFNTFGKLPGESRSYLNIIAVNSDGKPVIVISDITEQFADTTHIIVIPDTVVIPPPASGGIAPTVEEWEEINHDVPIG